MANVVAWPGSPTDPGFVNLHYSMPNPNFDPKKKVDFHNKKWFMSGWPYRDEVSFVNRVGWVMTVPGKFQDQWFCTSLQGRTGKNKAGKVKAAKSSADALKTKSLFVDIDTKNYANEAEALKAILDFQVKGGLPKPSAIVATGGGFHVYWISKTALLPHEWKPYAQGLKALLLTNNVKCDLVVTGDIARILRVPGSLNYKYDPPRSVELLKLPLVMYDFAPQFDFLKAYAGQATVKTVVAHQLFADGADMASFKNGPAFKIEGDPGLEAGIKGYGDDLLDPRPIFAKTGCGFLRDALRTGGKDYDQTLWMYSVLCSTFMENGDEIAHTISSGHPTYSEVDTQALYDRKMAERHDRGIGYPSCSAIAGAGCKACASCPLFQKGKSPLNIRPEVTATVSDDGGPLPTSADIDDWLPSGFELNPKGIICKLVEQINKEDDSVSVTSVPLFQAVLSQFWLEKGGSGEQLNFTTTLDKGHSGQVAVALGKVSAQGFLSYLGEKSVLINPGAPPQFFTEFFLNTIGKLRALAAAHTAVPFGWYEEGGVRKGFVYGGKVMMDDGSERPCGTTDPNIARCYAPTGSLEKWMNSAKVILDRKRPELSVIVLMSFMAPLLELVGRETVLFSAVSYGSDSGAGKSSAYKIGMSVWGHPILTKGTETQTPNNITTIMKTIRNLPFYWDEINDPMQQEKVAKVMHEADGGKEKGRNKSGSETQMSGTWALPIHYASNLSYLSFLRQRNATHEGSINRVLEWEVKKKTDGVGQLKDADATILINDTYRNYGHMGLKYAKFLALNHKDIAEECREAINRVQEITHGGDSDRYWLASVGLMTQAAKYAQKMGLDVDPAQIEKFMFQVYANNAAMRDDFGAGDVLENAETALTRYLKERDGQERGIWTNYMHNERGKPPKPVQLLKMPSQLKNTQGGIEFRFAVENKQLIISVKDFDNWLKVFKYAENQIYAGLNVIYNTQRRRLAICSGWLHDSGREPCLILNIKPDTPLWTYMVERSAPEEREAAARSEETGPIDTGLTPAEDVVAFVKGATGSAANAA